MYGRVVLLILPKSMFFDVFCADEHHDVIEWESFNDEFFFFFLLLSEIGGNLLAANSEEEEGNK